jgi:Flp pilus assembly protein TadD
MGLFTHVEPVATSLVTTTLPIVPASTVPPPSTVATEVAVPPTTIAPPPTTTTVAIVPPPSVVAPPPPPSTTVEDTSEEPEPETEPAASPRPDDPQWLVDRANFRRSHGDLPGAEADYLHVLRVSPNNARAQAGLARLHLARHDARTAATWARRLAEGHTANAGNYVLLGDTLQATGDSASARRAWERALAITPGYRDARRRLGR